MRARNIKPGVFHNEDLADCGRDARLLFIGLWCAADRAGRLEDRPRTIKVDIFPFDDDVNVDELLNVLDTAGFIRRYTKHESRYIQVVNFEKHQRPHSNEAESKIPPEVDDEPTSSELNTGERTQESEATTSKVRSTAHQGEQHGTPRGQALRPDSLIPDSLIARERTAPASAAPAPIPKPIRPDQAMWDAFGFVLDYTPATKSERGKWNDGIKQLRDADVCPDDVPWLVDGYRALYGPRIACNPAAIASNLGPIRAARASPTAWAESEDFTGIARRIHG